MSFIISDIGAKYFAMSIISEISDYVQTHQQEYEDFLKQEEKRDVG
jgi:hypothetical protein